MLKQILILGLLVNSAVAVADWRVDPEGSHVGFASVKNDIIAENHTFTEVAGRVSATGAAEISITLASVETLIPIRNERMQTLLFNIAEFPMASVRSQVPTHELATMNTGESRVLNIDIVIDLHGAGVKKKVPVKVTSLGSDSFDVSSLGPIVVHASQFALSDSVEALRKIAGLQSIDLMVPVTFDLRLVAAD